MSENYHDEDCYRIMAEASGASVFEWDLKNGTFYSSDSFLKYALSQCSPMDILANRASFSTVHPDDLPSLFSFFSQCKSGQTKNEVALRLKMVDGSYRWSRLIGIQRRDDNGVPTRTIGAILDINEEREKSRLIEGLMNAIPGGVAVCRDLCVPEFIYYSEGLPALLHRTRAEFDALCAEPNALEKLISSEDIERYKEAAAESTKNSAPLAINFRAIDRKGASIWIHMSASAIREEDGSTLYYVIFTQPELESAMYQDVVSDAQAPIIVADRNDNTVLYMNKAFRRMYPQSIRKAEDTPLTTTDIFPDSRLVMTKEKLASLSESRYEEERFNYSDGRCLCLRSRRLTWLGRQAYIQYISDESELHRKQKKLKDLLDRIPGGLRIYEVREHKVHLKYLNEGYFRMLSAKRQDRECFSEDRFYNAAHPDDRATAKAALKKAEHGSGNVSLTIRVLNGKNRYIWLRLNAVYMPVSEDCTEVYCCYTDVDEQFRQQLELHRKFEERTNYIKALSRGAKASFLINITKNDVSEIMCDEKRTLDFLRTHSGDEVHDQIAAAIPDLQEREKYRSLFNRKALRETFETGESRVLFRHHYQNSSLWIESSCDMIENPTTGDLEGFCFLRDISEEKRAEDVVSRLIATDYDSIFTFDAETGAPKPFRNGPVDEVMKEQKKLGDNNAGVANYLRKNCIDMDVEQVVHNNDLYYIKEMLEKAPCHVAAYTVQDENGRARYKRAYYSYLNEDKKTVVGSVKDVTSEYESQMRQRELLKNALDEAKNANLAKTSFLSNMSHEIRTPMNAILGMTKRARDELGRSNPTVDEYLAQIDASGAYLLGVINDILDMSRIESGKFELHREWVSPTEIARSCIEMIAPILRARNITFNHPKIGSSLFCYEYFMDALKVKQLMMNLLNNASKFTEPGGHVTITFRNLKTDMAASTTIDQVTVEDDGCGMSKEFLKRIFNPFEQERTVHNASVNGTGLGLALAKRIATAMGGTIEVESEPGRGAKFTVTIPWLFRKTEEKTKEQQLPPKSLEGRKILLAEDQELNAVIAKKLLEKRGMKVDRASNGAEALSLFAGSPEKYYDAILMDVRMPVMDGLLAASAIRAMPRADASSVPIIAMTANAFEEDRKNTRNAGMTAHLTKPVNPELLYLVIGEQLRDRE